MDTLPVMIDTFTITKIILMIIGTGGVRQWFFRLIRTAQIVVSILKMCCLINSDPELLLCLQPLNESSAQTQRNLSILWLNRSIIHTLVSHEF